MRLLLVEDEEKLARLVKRTLVAERFSVDVARTGRAGMDLANTYDYDLMILDLQLPELSGSEILRRVRRGNPNVLILTARDAVVDKVAHFEAGADDYLTKPFAMAELIVRAKSLLRRGTGRRENVLRVTDLELDRLTQQVRKSGRSIELANVPHCRLPRKTRAEHHPWAMGCSVPSERYGPLRRVLYLTAWVHAGPPEFTGLRPGFDWQSKAHSRSGSLRLADDAGR